MVLIEDVDDEPTKVEAKPSSEWRRIQVVEADSDDDAEANVEPPKASRPQRVWSDPCPDLEITCTVAGIEDAKSRGNRLYVDGKLAESERWFTKAIWFYESGKVREVPGDLRCALHTNRALARLKLQRFADAEHDCSTVLEEKPENGKARYRRATARFEQGKLVPALEDAKKALLSLPTDSRGEAQEMKAQIEEHLGPMAGENGSQQSKKEVKENGYHRIPIKEVDKEETQPNHQPPKQVAQANGPGGEANGPGPETEPYPDIQLEPTLAGAEKAKQRANELFQKGEVAESVRWFSKAIWLLDSGTISGAAALRSILHSNRAFARSKLQQWPEVEADCNEALTFNEKNAKALFRRSHARLEMNKLDAALADVNLLLPLLAPPTNKEALDLKARIVESMERDKAQRSSQSKELEAAAKSVAKPKESKALKEEATTKPATPSQPPAGFRRMEIVEADDSSEEEAKPATKPKEAAKPKEETAAKPVTPSQPPAGFKRMEIVEASDDESEEEAKPAAKPKEAPAEPFADIKLEHSVAGAEKAKDTGNKLFQEGKIEESERWFSKAIWLVEESGKVTVSGTLRGILHSNRAFARLTLRQWSSAETDCNEALKLNSENPKALYRRALARKELEKFQSALEDANQLLPKLDAQNNAAATKLKEELESKIRSAAAVNGTDTAKGKPASPSQPPAGFKRMEIVEAEASEDESEEDAVPEKPKQETAPTSAAKPASQPPAGFKRMEIVEASDDEEEVDATKPKEEPQKPERDAGKAPVEPFADIQLEHSVAGVEKAKDTGNKLFQEGKLAESERWFSKAIWLAEESGKVAAPDNLRSILHSNRAFARLQLSEWSAAETDCNKALELNGNMAKALYRRALARKELKKFQAALDDVKQLLPLLEPPQTQNAQKLKDELESKLAAATAPAMNGKNRAEDPPAKPASPSQPAGFKRMEILEASDDESEEEAAPVAKPKEAPSEPFADIQLEHSVAGAEKAKDTGNKLFQEGKIEDSERWFSKAIWLVEESGKVNAPDSLKAILHSNRAYARLQLEHWSSAEGDCSEALKLNSKNPKALYRRALARKGLNQFQGALEDVKHLLPLLDSQNNAQALKLKEELESKLGIAPLVNGSDNEKAPAKASPSRPVEPVATPAEPLRPELQRPSSAPAEQPPSPSSGSSLARPSASARALAATPSIPSSSPKNSMEMLRQFKSLKKHPAVLTKYITQKVSPALLQSLFNRSPIEADDLALVLQSLRTAASDEAEPLTGDRVGEYLQQLLRTHTADTQFSMLSTSEKEMVRNLASLAPNGDDLKKTFAKVL